jgi:hypothetical protein
LAVLFRLLTPVVDLRETDATDAAPPTREHLHA